MATANSVIASAKRLIDVRHVCLKSSRMAEISVPAWPMPIHHTKLMMANPQPTGMLMPHTPVPTKSRYTIEIIMTFTRMNAMPKPNHQPSDVLRVRTIALILSVTDAKVCPGAMTGGGTRPPAATGACASCGVRESGGGVIRARDCAR